MTTVTNTIDIVGALETVFDIVTTAKGRPDWHPATVGVSGNVETPMQLGDTIHERARIGGGRSGVIGEWSSARARLASC